MDFENGSIDETVAPQLCGCCCNAFSCGDPYEMSTMPAKTHTHERTARARRERNVSIDKVRLSQHSTTSNKMLWQTAYGRWTNMASAGLFLSASPERVVGMQTGNCLLRWKIITI